MDEPIQTPPVLDLPYSGPERRRTDPLAQAISAAVQKGNGRPAPPDPTRWIVAAAVIVLQVLVLVSQFRLADRQTNNTRASERFRASLTCFLVEFSKPADQQRRGTDLLTACGFLKGED